MADPAGRFIIVSGKLQGVPVALASVYGPNWDDSAFITKFFTSFPNIANYHIIVGGDFNLVQDPTLDRSSVKVFPLTKSAKTLSTLTEQLGLSDPWRRTFPTTKLFSFFSHVHRTYSRIDFFLQDNRLFPNVDSCDYHSIVISDHAPTSLDLNFRVQTKPFKQWRFNSALLAEDGYRQFLRTQITLFFELNDLPETKRGTLWEASKAYIRGQLISFVSNLKKTETSHMKDLMEQIKDVDNKYSSDPDPNLYKERLKGELRSI